ncbi:MAG TPA: DUF507 family protein [Candidatus Manganitrophaceae bacterium]|nr:DUF507 family protein [Candidatus Manganitrophaceae bacterium]
MILSEEKITHLSHLILQGLEKDPGVQRSGGREALLRCIKRTIVQELRQDEAVDEIVRQKLASYSRKIIEGSPEWDVLYHKTFNEEMKKRRK